ncbi:hypothetical protein OSB04_026292 [Centaurea solstitialis]|uniref:Uncharacterized protein n=1 Tax=Centaurea solstitialis TaxID=347529 RepID=A0AA38SNQ0_9ASTR|nr:hypothetical protein OSB04_026292 [Centaurea solstitialis]
MLKAKGTTPKALRIQLHQQHQEGVAYDHHESSFRVLYYASAGSVPFTWESHPGTPKHALTESSLPPLTPPPSFQNRMSSSMQLTKRLSSKRSGFLRTVFLAAYRKTAAVDPAAAAPSFSSCSISSSASSSCSSSGSTSEEWRRRSAGKEECGGGGGSPTSTLCYGGGFRKGYKVKKVKRAILGFVRNRKA